MIKKIIYSLLLVVIVIVGYLLISSNLFKNTSNQNNKIQIVAAENFWGSLLSQIGGNQVDVTSLVTDPNADPHEYEVSSTVAKQFAKANYIVLNGAGYDSWAQSMINSAASSNAVILNVASLLGKKNGDNPHFWYNPIYVNETVLAMKNDLVKIRPSQTAYFNKNYQTLLDKLKVYQNNLASIKNQFSGQKIASTEDIFVYMASASGLNLISPIDFMQAVANGNDPSASSIVEFQDQIKNHQVKLLIFNAQTVNPITDSMKTLAAQNHIPVVAITETISPPGLSFEDWMNGQVINIKNNL